MSVEFLEAVNMDDLQNEPMAVDEKSLESNSKKRVLINELLGKK